MSISVVISALAIPTEARVDQRVPKKLLIEQGAPTAADRRQIQDGIVELYWIAALKPTNIGVPAYRDGIREYLEIAVLSLTLRTMKAARIVELVHRAVPYPVVLVTALDNGVSISLAHKRWSEGEGGKVVVDELRKSVTVNASAPRAEDTAFLASLALSSLPSRDMFTLYQGWIDRLVALDAARITGSFVPTANTIEAGAVRELLESHARITRDLIALRAQAGREKQMNRRVELNLHIKQLEAELATVTTYLGPGGPG